MLLKSIFNAKLSTEPIEDIEAVPLFTQTVPTNFAQFLKRENVQLFTQRVGAAPEDDTAVQLPG